MNNVLPGYKKGKWDEEEVEFLKKLLVEEKYTYNELSLKLNRNKNNIKAKIYKMNLSPKPLQPNEIRLNEDEKRVWKTIDIFPGYKISNDGHVYSEKTKRVLNKIKNSSGYYHICLTIDGKMQYQLLHRLIAMAFIPNPDNKPFVNHIDGNKKNNMIENLEWVTNQENIKHAFDIGIMKGKPSCRKRKVVQIDKNTNKIIQEFDSQLEASHKLNIHPGSLSSCLNKRYKTSGGYIWKYKEEVENE